MATNEEVQKLANLSRVYIPEDQAEAFATEFESILSYVSSLETLTLSPLSENEAGVHKNVFREDGTPHAPGAYTEKAVAAFPEKEGNSLKVKKILSHE